MPGGREVATPINLLLSDSGFAVRLATLDHHPQDHVSFASNHDGASNFETITIGNPKNSEEYQEAMLWPDHCVQGTKGAQLISELDQSKLTHVVKKGEDARVESYSAFGPPFRSPRIGESDLGKILHDEGITHVFCVGLAFDFCVKCTAVDAAEEGFKTYVIEEASKASDQSETGLQKVRQELLNHGVTVISMDSEILRKIREQKAE